MFGSEKEIELVERKKRERVCKEGFLLNHWKGYAETERENTYWNEEVVSSYLNEEEQYTEHKDGIFCSLLNS